MRNAILLMAMGGLALESCPASGQEPAATIAPLINEDTTVVIHVNLEKLNHDNLLNYAQALGLITEMERKTAATEWKQFHERFVKSGGRDVFLLAGLSDLPFLWPIGNRVMPTIVVPLREGADADKLIKLISDLPVNVQNVEKVGQFVVTQDLIIFTKFKPSPRPELAQALATAGASDIRFAFLPPSELRRAVAEMAPMLPPEVGGGSTRPLSQGMRFLAGGIDSQKPGEIRFVLQSTDADMAQQLKRIVREGIDVGLNRIVKELTRNYAATPVDAKELAKVLANFQATVTANQVVVTVPLDKSVESFARMAHEALKHRLERTDGTNRLKQIGLAFHNFHDVYKRFPGNIVDKNGKPLLSWRVALLPFVEQTALFNEFHLDEPWDSEHNKKLGSVMPRVYRRSTSKADFGKTTYLMPVGKDTMLCPDALGIMWNKDRKGFVSRDAKKPGFTFSDIPDGTSNTIMTVDATDELAVWWTKPDDWTPDAADPRKGVVGSVPGGFLAGFVDGSVRLIPAKATVANLRAYLTRSGGEVIGE